MEGAKRILAIESSGRFGSVAALWGTMFGSRLALQSDLGEQRTAQSLAPTIKNLLRELDWSPAAVDILAVAVGPGSFTGLRIGVTTAKVFAYAAKSVLIGVNALEVIATQAPACEARLWTILDAQRQELFAASFQRSSADDVKVETPTAIMAREDWFGALRAGDRVTGPAVERIAQHLPQCVEPTPKNTWQPMADSVGSIAWKNYLAGHRDDLWSLVPQYYRVSAAEERILP